MNICFFVLAGLMVLAAILCFRGVLDANKKINRLRLATSKLPADQWNPIHFREQWDPIHTAFVMNVAFFVLSLIAATILFVGGLVFS